VLFRSTKTLLIGALIILFPVALVMLQPDTGSALAFFALVFVFYREGYVGNTLLLLGGLAILLFISALLINQWIIISILALIAGLFIYLLRKKRKYIINVGLLFLGCSVYVLCVDYAY